MTRLFRAVTLVFGVALAFVVLSLAGDLRSAADAQAAQATAPAPAASAATNAKTWLADRAKYEEFLRTAEVTKSEEIPVGVTKPIRCQLEPGGPFAEMAWKTIRPDRYAGYWESYKNEVAAYELDKLLGLDMIPPTVERKVKGSAGAAVMWVSPTKSFKQLGGPPTPPGQHMLRWNRQMARAKMFDNLIGNLDPNLGNWLVDPDWNLILIDHTRAFTTDKKLVHALQSVDAQLWAKMQELTEPALDQAIGSVLGGGERKAILERRDRMAKAIDELVKKKGEAAVMFR